MMFILTQKTNVVYISFSWNLDDFFIVKRSSWFYFMIFFSYMNIHTRSSHEKGKDLMFD